MNNATILLGSRRDKDGIEQPVSLKTSALTTHAAIFGATGSGKTGLIIGMIEDMVRLGVPVAAIDIKGDLANLALQPNGSDVRDKMAIRFLTPGADHGEAVNIFSGIANPDRVTSTVSTLCKMLGVESDPLRSKAHSFISTIIQWRLRANKPVTIIDIMQDINDPPFEFLGVLPLEDVFPAASRGKLAAKLNNIVAAPSFQSWREGIDINIDKLFSAKPGKTPVVIFSVAHLVDDSERIFAISMFLEEMVSWMRKQPGVNDLKSCLLLDEMYGVMPPHPAAPPTKKPLLTMLKQARAHGLGVVICSQNPMDVDYKGMSNAQTWLVGRLQTERDRDRVVAGICSATTQEERTMGSSISRLQPRQFLVVRPTGTAIFNTKDCQATLQGPMSPNEIRELFQTGIAEELGTMDKLAILLDNCRAAFEKNQTDANWKALEEVQAQIDAEAGRRGH